MLQKMLSPDAVKAAELCLEVTMLAFMLGGIHAE